MYLLNHIEIKKTEWRLRAALSDFAFSFGECCTRGSANLCTTRDDRGARTKKVRDHTQGCHLDMFITCVPFGFHNGMDESFSSRQQQQQQEVWHLFSSATNDNAPPRFPQKWTTKRKRPPYLCSRFLATTGAVLANHETLTREEDLDLEGKSRARQRSLRAANGRN
jgi:hypothetical protein